LELSNAYPLFNFHYTELFIYFNDFLNLEETLPLETFILANQNLLCSYYKTNKNSVSESQKGNKDQTKLLKKLFKILIQKEENEESKQSNHLTLIELLKYCIALGNNNTAISDLYSFMDKASKGSVEKDEFSVYLKNLLEFNFAEEKKINKKTSEKDFEAAEADNDDENSQSSQSESEIQEKIDKISSEFTCRINFKKFNKSVISKSDFINIFEKNQGLKEELIGIIKNTEEVIFSRVFNFNFNLPNESKEEEILNEENSSESKLVFSFI